MPNLARREKIRLASESEGTAVTVVMGEGEEKGKTYRMGCTLHGALLHKEQVGGHQDTRRLLKLYPLHDYDWYYI